MKKTFFLLVAMLIASVTAMAQNVSISGKVADAIICRNIQDIVIEKSGFEENAKFFNEKAKPVDKHQSNFAKNSITFNY